ncbi:MAG TPA: metal-sensing transcriptional repressor [Ramlibacter sp.]|nr:metal-sensing transcriptional repressor [Ramlibacter sp.]
MASLTNASARADILTRLKRAEGQLRGIQRMVEEGATCLDVAQQFSAVRKALDSTYVRMTMCMLEQELQARLQSSGKPASELGALMADLQKLLTRMG